MYKDEWLELLINTPNDYEELIYSVLYDYDISTFEIIDYRTYLDTVKDKPYWVELNHNLIEKSDNLIIKIYLPKKEFPIKLVMEIKDKLIEIDDNITVDSNKTIEDIDWSKEWKKHYKPFKIGERIVIKPSWESYDKKENDIIIEIDPQMAFGTGTHETTSLCVEVLQKLDLNNKVLCDIGSGSGILSIVSAKLGASKVNAVDIDPISVKTTLDNSKINKVDNIVKAYEGDLLDHITEKSDMVIANILHNIIVDLIPDLNRILKTNGYFVASGIIYEKKDLILEKLNEYNFEVLEVYEKGEWVCILAKNNNA